MLREPTDALTAALGQRVPRVLVTVEVVTGAAPREPGARMLVTPYQTQFERRLQERGIPASRLASMSCPIGVPGIADKAPAAIAASVAAQLFQVWESTH